MSFDTTASNTGRKNGACQFLEKKFKAKLIGLPCRHHVYEILLGKAFKVLKFETSTSPNVEFFKFLKDAWSTLVKSSYRSGERDSFFKKVITEDERKSLIEWFKNQMEEYHHRDDYREVLQLAVLFLGGAIEANVTIRAPGAFHNARWMAKIIYCLKMFLYRYQLKLPKEKTDRLVRFNVFVVKIYLKKWFVSPNAAKAPGSDLEMLKVLKEYEVFDKDISNAVFKGCLPHLQYLDSTLIALSLFDEDLPIPDKKKIVKAILKSGIIYVAYTNQFIHTLIFLGSREETTARNIVETKDVRNLQLCSFVKNRRSVQNLFDALDVTDSFLKEKVENWGGMEEYSRIRRRVTKLAVVNDNAERGIALIKSFNSKLSRDEEQKQCILQLVEHHRKIFKSPNKADVIEGMK